MKKITVMRHAEAGQASRDFDRRLTEYGQSQSRNVAAQLVGLINPQLLVVSSANRTRDTAEYLIEALGTDDNCVRFDDRVYEASTEDLKSIIVELSDDVSEVMLVGHNPSISSLVSAWSDSYAGFSTACSVILEIDTDHWSDSVFKTANIIAKVLPKS